VSSEELEEVPLQLNRGKGRPKKTGKPLSFTVMLGLGNPKTRYDCNLGLEAEMRMLTVLEEEEDKEHWDDLPPNADNPEAPFSLGLGAQGTKPEDKLHALLQKKVAKENEKESLAKGKGSGKRIQWPGGLVQQEATLAQGTASGGNIVNPQAQPLALGDEENGEEVASSSMRVHATDQGMMDALLESPKKRKELGPPLLWCKMEVARRQRNPRNLGTQRRSARRRGGQSGQGRRMHCKGGRTEVGAGK
jgi:hypothetical protein